MLTGNFRQDQISNFQQSIALDSEAQSLQVLNDTYADGKFDAAIGLDPQPYQWRSADYRKGYIDKMNEKLGAA